MLVEVSFRAESVRVSVAGQIRICGDFEAESVGRIGPRHQEVYFSTPDGWLDTGSRCLVPSLCDFFGAVLRASGVGTLGGYWGRYLSVRAGRSSPAGRSALIAAAERSAAFSALGGFVWDVLLGADGCSACAVRLSSSAPAVLFSGIVARCLRSPCLVLRRAGHAARASGSVGRRRGSRRVRVDVPLAEPEHLSTPSCGCSAVSAGLVGSVPRELALELDGCSGGA